MPTPSTDRIELWDAETTYVIGHQRPDTDAIASALGYAWLLTQSGYDSIRAVRCGQPGEQAQFALKRFGQIPPAFLPSVAVVFAHITESQASVSPEAPLSDALDRFSSGEQVVPVVGENRVPVGIVTPLALARSFSKRLRGNSHESEPTCREIAEKATMYRERERIADHRNQVLRSEENSVLIIDDNGLYVGMAEQKALLAPPRAKLILVDHNELSQAVTGAEEADIVGVLDHHRLGNPPTASPIPFTVDPVGSTSTLVAEKCRDRTLEPPPSISGLLLSGILSDTLVFKSPTTAARDRAAAAWLANICRLDMHQYGAELLHASSGLGAKPLADILDGDRKGYEMAGVNVSIAQVEVTGMQELPARIPEIVAAMDDTIGRENIGLFCLMVTDVVTGESRMLVRGQSRLVAAIPFRHMGESLYDLGDIVSRKKQLVPALVGIMETYS
ncbi:MAG: DHH family phosphoesterase [Armatimonadetes bacterium]|nr:DHH family phosphoesterase [Armatimonadota bacterium]